MSSDPHRTGAEHDHPAWSGPVRSYVIASLPRTGSTMLARSLEAAGVGVPAEYLNPLVRSELSDRWGKLALPDYLERVRGTRTVGGYFGLKVHFNHFEPLRSNHPTLDWIGDANWISLTRLDRISQAVSLDLARRTGRWWAGSRRRFATYGPTAITNRFDEIHSQEIGWERFYLDHEIEPLRITTENLFEQPHMTIGTVLMALGADGEAEVVTQPSNDRRTERWARRYRRGHK
jgi:LPS sulfotransferase NodH